MTNRLVSAILTVRVVDVNDNAPVFILDTLSTLRSVVEEAAAGTLIGEYFVLLFLEMFVGCFSI